jgi:hypothetical protein
MQGLTTGGGFLLSCLRVVDQGGVNSVRVGSSRGGKRVSREDGGGAGGEGQKKKQKREAVEDVGNLQSEVAGEVLPA